MALQEATWIARSGENQQKRLCDNLLLDFLPSGFPYSPLSFHRDPHTHGEFHEERLQVERDS